MKIKIFTAMTERGLEKKVNQFFAEEDYVEIVDVKFAGNASSLAVMVLYK